LIKEHNEEFESEEQLRGWLDEAGIEYDERSFIGRVRRPRQDHWNEDAPLPGYSVCLHESSAE
jgi:hypothetical protein